MDITRIPADASKYLAQHATDAELAALAMAALKILADRGTSLPVMLIDEIEEVHIEVLARQPGGLDGFAPAATDDMLAGVA